MLWNILNALSCCCTISFLIYCNCCKEAFKILKTIIELHLEHIYVQIINCKYAWDNRSRNAVQFLLVNHTKVVIMIFFGRNQRHKKLCLFIKSSPSNTTQDLYCLWTNNITLIIIISSLLLYQHLCFRFNIFEQTEVSKVWHKFQNNSFVKLKTI